MLKIKLSRIGKKKHPIYRLIVSEVGRDPYGKSLEILGSWDPHTKNLQVSADRVKHWIGHGAQLTDTIHNLFIEKKIIEGKKVNVSALGKKAKEAVKKGKAASAESSVEPKAASASAEASSSAKATEDKTADKSAEVVNEPKAEETPEVVETPATEEVVEPVTEGKIE